MFYELTAQLRLLRIANADLGNPLFDENAPREPHLQEPEYFLNDIGL